MNKVDKRLLWYQGAKFALKTLKHLERLNGDIELEAQELLDIPAMTKILRDDFWAKGFVMMLKKKAGKNDNHHIEEQDYVEACSEEEDAE